MLPKAPFADCEHCPAKDRPFVPPEPAKRRLRLAVVGEAPGGQEVIEKRPFIGQSGRLINNTLRYTSGLEREDCHWTNAVLCHIPDRDLAKARKCCAPRLQAELEAAGAETVLTLGAYGLQSTANFSRKPQILRYRGAVIEPSDLDKLDETIRGEHPAGTIIPTVHPAFTLRSPLWMPIFEADVAKAGRIAQNGYTPPEADGRIEVIRSFEQLKELLPTLGEEVAVDIETVETVGHNNTKGPDIHTNYLTCFVIADEQLSLVIPWSKTLAGQGKYFNGNQPIVEKFVQSELRKRIAVTHNGPAYDHIGLARNGIVLGEWDDTLLAYHVITSHFPKRLEHVVACYLDAPPWKKFDHGNDLKKLWEYCGRDGLYTIRAKKLLWATMDESDHRVYESDKRSATICRSMSTNGFAFDRQRASLISDKLREREAEIQRECASLTGMKDFNPLSPLQLREAFFKRMGAHVCFRSASGAPSLGKDSMRAYAGGSNSALSDLALKILEYRNVRKCRATYVDGIRVHEDGRVRPNWLSYGTVSGRWSAQGPNLANLPKKQNDAARALGGIRSLYVAPEGRKLVAFDLKQAEFRIAAYYSGDKNMIAVCESGGDIHWMNACRIFGLPPTTPYDPANGKQKELRDLAKNAVFAVCYMAEAGTVHANITGFGGKATLQQVEAMLSSMRVSFKDYYEFQAELLNKTIRYGYVESPILGRKRRLGHDPKAPENANFPIQSGAADVMNDKCWRISWEIDQRRYDAKPVAMVYDQLILDTADRDTSRVERLVTEVFEQPVKIGGREMVMPIDLKVGERWSDL